MSTGANRLGTLWERRTIRTALAFSILALAVLTLLAFMARPTGKPLWLTLPFAGILSFGLYDLLTRKLRRRRKILSQPFPPQWEEVLLREVVFFRALEPAERVRFRRELQVFLGEKLITGIKTQLDETTRVLASTTARGTTPSVWSAPGR
jgi:hypothetical protein